MVPVVGLEPTRYCYQRILSPSRLPIPSHRHLMPYQYTEAPFKKQDPVPDAVVMLARFMIY